MKAKQTYIFVISFVAFLLSSCASDVADDVEVSKGCEMSFAVAGITRASVTTSFNEFTVYGDLRNAEEASSHRVVLFDKTKVEYKGSEWTYAGTQYWFPNREHSFVAVSPSSALESAAPLYSNSRLSFTYTIPVTNGILKKNSDVSDIIVATHRKYYELDEKNSFVVDPQTKVTLNFGHLLSLINLAPAFSDNILKEDAYMLIHKVELSGFKTKADFKITPASLQSNAQTDDMVVEVDARKDGEGTLTIEFANPVKIFNNGQNVTLFDSNDAILMLPQDFADDSEAKITLYYKFNDDPAENKDSILLNNLKWESGKSYLYKFTFGRIGVNFDSYEINPWNVIRGDEIVVD